MKHAFLAFAAAALISGCSVAPTVNFSTYSLTDGVAASAFASPYSVSVKLNGALAEGGLVLRMNEVTLRAAKNHRWDGELARQLEVIVNATYLSRRVNPQVKSIIHVAQFCGDPSGNVTISAHLTAANGTKTFSKSYNFSARQDADGYDALAQKLKEGWIDMATKMASDAARL